MNKKTILNIMISLVALALCFILIRQETNSKVFWAVLALSFILLVVRARINKEVE